MDLWGWTGARIVEGNTGPLFHSVLYGKPLKMATSAVVWCMAMGWDWTGDGL